MHILSVADVLRIHDKVVADAGGAVPREPVTDPSKHPRVKNPSLLCSAVGRQSAGVEGQMFYPTPLGNAATLMFGLAKNHPFHDGNKRTALVAMLNHLDANHLGVTADYDEVERVVLELVEETLANRPRLRQAVSKCPDRHERAVAGLQEWLRQNTRRIERGDHNVTFNELQRLLEPHGFVFGKPYAGMIDLFRVTKRKTLFLRREKTEQQGILAMRYTGGSRTIPIPHVKNIRERCGLTEQDGVDSAAFYRRGDPLDEIINKYRSVLRRLAKK